MDPIFTHRLEVRFRDCDPLGHANNAVYLTYLEQARFAHWRALGHASVEAGAPGVILAHADIDYRQPARYGDALEVRIGLVNIGRTSFTYEYEILSSAGGLVASARTVLVMYDYAASRPVPVPDELRAILPVPVASEP
ncbi:MAG TPA: thioesterase family protein [Vicinamibacterales bacterium]|jgi:acyl-CoA thioester hydrolase|nr:thioesterase family protein [Vicinamibacterales bacterium]